MSTDRNYQLDSSGLHRRHRLRADQSLIWLSALIIGGTHFAFLLLNILFEEGTLLYLNGGFALLFWGFSAYAKRVQGSRFLPPLSALITFSAVCFFLNFYPGPIALLPFIILPAPALRILGFLWGGLLACGVIAIAGWSLFSSEGLELYSFNISVNILFAYFVAAAFGVMLEVSRLRSEMQLESTFKKLRILNGLIPICSSCKSIHDGENCWDQIESFLHAAGQVEFTHGLCPGCMEIARGDLARLSQATTSHPDQSLT